MFKSIELINFKCFQRQRIVFRPLTLLTGVNSAGKSTVIQALLLLQQNFSLFCEENAMNNLRKVPSSRKVQELHLSGALVNLGLAEDVLYANANEDVLTFNIEDDSENFSLNATLDGDNLYADWNHLRCPDPKHFQYLQADRLNSCSLFPVPQVQHLLSNSIGNRGEFAAYHLHESGQAKILHGNACGANLLAANAAGDSTTLQIQTEGWLSQLGSSVRIETERPAGTDTVVLRFAFPDISGNYYRPSNVGFGLTYALPIFVAGLRAVPGALLIVENPEAHLHPKGQALMGEFLARAAACGIQVIIETHSDHVLNGIRVAVKRAQISPDDVQINFFHQQAGQSIVSVPKIDKDGHIDEWPEDFFDEWDKQLSELL